MQIQERKIGRVFRIRIDRGEEFFEVLTKFAREHNVREATLTVIGAMDEGRMITGFLSPEGYDVNRRPIGPKREFLGFGSLTWPEAKPPAIEEDLPWDEPQPYPHVHMALGPQVGPEQKEVLVGHLSRGLAIGMFVDVIEFL